MNKVEKKFGKGKAALMAAASLLAASAALSPATASTMDPAAHPAIVSVEATAPIAHAGDHASENKPLSPKKWALLAVAAGALGWLIKLIGARRVADAVAEGAVKTARVAASAASGALKVVGRTFASPLRFLGVMFGLALFALTGVGLFDAEWIGGLISGAALMGAGLYGVLKTRKALIPVKTKARTRPEPNMDNEN
ncbi:hypothetical protein [Hyphococcus sp.]|uniref:hypothetical protein n=1 Tax=Hyphococcus sp. TaxID=2038636 RepID=UPI0037504AC6